MNLAVMRSTRCVVLSVLSHPKHIRSLCIVAPRAPSPYQPHLQVLAAAHPLGMFNESAMKSIAAFDASAGEWLSWLTWKECYVPFFFSPESRIVLPRALKPVLMMDGTWLLVVPMWYGCTQFNSSAYDAPSSTAQPVMHLLVVPSR